MLALEVVEACQEFTGNREVRLGLRCPWQAQEEGDNGSDNRKDNRACAVLGETVHHDRKGQDVGCHDEDQDAQLRHKEHPVADRTEQELASVRKAVNTHVFLLELANHNTCIRLQSSVWPLQISNT